jgi:broad specificity phosphatase PhoE
VTTFFLVRHGTHDLLDRVYCGRMPDVSLNANGREQSERLGRRLAREGIDFMQSSPLERARETAGPISWHTGALLEIAPALNEVDIGEWTGRPFAEIARDPEWRQWNSARTVARPPAGESMSEAQQRVIRHLDHVRATRPDSRVVLVSHSEIVRAIVLYYLGMSLNDYGRIEISPGSLSTLVVETWGGRLLGLNEIVAA